MDKLYKFLFEKTSEVSEIHVGMISRMYERGLRFPSDNPDEVLYRFLKSYKFNGQYRSSYDGPYDGVVVEPNITYKIVEILLKHGANPNYAINEEREQSCLHFTTNNFELMKLLVSYGADTNLSKCDDERSLLDDILSGPECPEQLDMIKFLVEHGADVNEKLTVTSDGTPIVYDLIAYGPLPFMDVILKYLLEVGLDITQTDNTGITIIGKLKERLDDDEVEDGISDVVIDIPEYFTKFRDEFDDYTQQEEDHATFKNAMITRCIQLLKPEITVIRSSENLTIEDITADNEELFPEVDQLTNEWLTEHLYKKAVIKFGETEFIYWHGNISRFLFINDELHGSFSNIDDLNEIISDNSDVVLYILWYQATSSVDQQQALS